MRALFALVVWLASLAAGGAGVCMAADSDEIHLGPLTAPPWTASANEQVTSDHAGFDPCEQFVKLLASRGGSKVTAETYTTSPRWGKILRAKITFGGGGPMVATCWIGADGHASIVMKNDDGEP
jgi:hypothetical protein